MAIVHMMVGIQGSGKSTYSRKLNIEFGYPIVSTDIVRKNHPDWEESMIWPEVYRLVANYLKDSQDVIFDATNITPKVRKRFKDEVDKLFNDYNIYAYYFNTPLEVCVDRVSKRNEDKNELYLPPEVISSYYERLVIPTLDEGFIKVIDALKE